MLSTTTQARNSGKSVARGQEVGNLSRVCVCVCVVRAYGSPLCHAEEGWRKKAAAALNK